MMKVKGVMLLLRSRSSDALILSHLTIMSYPTSPSGDNPFDCVVQVEYRLGLMVCELSRVTDLPWEVTIRHISSV